MRQISAALAGVFLCALALGAIYPRTLYAAGCATNPHGTSELWTFTAPAAPAIDGVATEKVIAGKTPRHFVKAVVGPAKNVGIEELSGRSLELVPRATTKPVYRCADVLGKAERGAEPERFAK